MSDFEKPPKPPIPGSIHARTPLSIQKKERRKNWYKHRNTRLRYDNWLCQHCRNVRDETETGKGMIVHHIKPLFLGGTDDIYNLITYCARCDRIVAPQD